MEINVKSLETNLPFEFEVALDASEVVLVREDISVAETGRIKGMATLLDDGSVNVCGEASFELVGKCDRCLEQVRQKALIRFSEDFYPTENEEGYTYSDNIINLDLLVRDITINACPTVLLCNKNCFGLCAGCGAKKTSEKCNCNHKDEQENRQNPFEILKSGGTK